MNGRSLLAPLASAFFGTRRFNNRWTRRFARPIRDRRILEIGSGREGQSARPFFDASNEFITSDVNPALGHARVDVLSMEFREEFDVILCMNVLEHLPEPRQAVANIYRALRQGGTALFFVPGFYPLHDEPHDYWRFTEHSLRHLLAEFREVTVRHLGPRIYPFGYHVVARK